MTKTKAQLRAEAVERLNRLCDFADSDEILDSLKGEDERSWWEYLPDLLTDDCDTECYECSRLAELTAENSQLRVKVDELDNGNDGETNGIHADAPLVDGDAVDMLRKYVEECESANGKAGTRGKRLLQIADMVERDYVSREAYEDLRDEFVWETTFLHRMGKKCGTKDVPSLVAYVEQLEAERDEWKAKAERLANDTLPDENGVSDPDGGSNVVYIAQDTREKLEADVREFANVYYVGHLLVHDKVMELLDRQAAITRAECEKPNWDYCETCELQARVDELTEQLESAHAKNRSLKAHIAKMQEGRHGWHVKYPELEKKNAELQSDYDAIVAKCAELCALCGFSMVDINGEVVS